MKRFSSYVHNKLLLGNSTCGPRWSATQLSILASSSSVSLMQKCYYQSGKKRYEWNLRQCGEEDQQTLMEMGQAMAMETENRKIDEVLFSRGLTAPLRHPKLCKYFLAEEEVADPKDPNKKVTNYIGFFSYGLQWTGWRGGSLYYMYSAFVHKEHRRRGVFQSFFETLKEKSLEDDSIGVGVRLNVEKENVRAVRCYQTLGMSIEHYTLFKWMKNPDDFAAHKEQKLFLEEVSEEPSTSSNGDQVMVEPGSEIPLPTDRFSALPDAFPSEYPWKIRSATSKDLPAMLHLQKLKSAEQGIELNEAELIVGLAKPLSTPELAQMYIAEGQNGEVIGMALVTCEWHEWTGGMFYWVQNLVVSPLHRGKGVTYSLFKHMQELVLKDENANGLRTQVNCKAGGPQELIMRLGFKEEPYYLMRWQLENE